MKEEGGSMELGAWSLELGAWSLELGAKGWRKGKWMKVRMGEGADG